jgi:hypothetical protein
MSKALALRLLKTTMEHYERELVGMGHGILPEEELDPEYKGLIEEIKDHKNAIKWVNKQKS